MHVPKSAAREPRCQNARILRQERVILTAALCLFETNEYEADHSERSSRSMDMDMDMDMEY